MSSCDQAVVRLGRPSRWRNRVGHGKMQVQWRYGMEPRVTLSALTGFELFYATLSNAYYCIVIL